MRKKWLWLLPAMFILAGCAIERLSNIVNKGTDDIVSPSWDIKFDVPLGSVKAQLSKVSAVHNMLEKLKVANDTSVSETGNALIYMQMDPLGIDSSDFTVDAGVSDMLGSNSVLTWPLPVACIKSPSIQDTSIPAIKLDLDDNNTQDLMLSALQSKDGRLKIGLSMKFTDANGTERNAVKEDFFENGTALFAIEDVTTDGKSYAIKIGDQTFSFKEGYFDESDDKFILETKDFLQGEKPIKPLPAWEKDASGNYIYDASADHILSNTEYEYRISIPDGAFQVRGRSFSVIEDLLEASGITSQASLFSAEGRSNSRTVMTAAEIQARVQSANGDVSVLEELVDEGVSMEEIATAYNGDLDAVLTDSGVGVYDILASESLATDENLTVLGDAFGTYSLAGTTLADIGEVGNLSVLSEFCKFHKTNAIQKISLSFSVEVTLGDTFVLTAEFINDYEIGVNTDDTMDSLPYSKINKILESASLEAELRHNFAFQIKLKEPKFGAETAQINGIESDGNGYYVIPGEENSGMSSCHISFSLDEMPSEDGNAEIGILIPKEKEVSIALNPTEENDLYFEMALGVNGTLKIDGDEISELLSGSGEE